MSPPIRVCVVWLLWAAGCGTVRADDGEIAFSRDIRPILSNHCFKCHGPDEGAREADLRLDTEEGARAALEVDDGIAKLLARVTSVDPDLMMPPPEAKKPLKPAQVELLKRWVAEGAPWGTHWAFEPLAAPAVPEAPASEKEGIYLRNPIDHFVQARLAARKISPSPEASRETLIRRVTLDLTGLPPTPADVDAFVSDTADNAYEKIVDRLLQSPAYGERMAWSWLDAARYADSNGYQGDNERTQWPWRDWVVDAFNRNLPYDDFTVWQIAGDQLPSATFEQKLATGFCRNHMINGEGGRIAEENRVDYVMDMTETVGTVWLGLTMNCCRCHDHKFDPLAQRDYYRLFAFFNQTPVDGGGGNPQTPPVIDVPDAQQLARKKEIEAQVAALDEQLKQRAGEIAGAQSEWEKQALAASGDATWRPLTPVAMKAAHQSLKQLDDGSIFASGENPRNDTYTLTLKTDVSTIAALRLDALRHERHTHGGLGRSDSGNFVLTEIELSIQRPGDAKPSPVKIASGVATFEQGGFSIANAFDGNHGSGWAVWAGKPIDREHAALFRLAEPLAAGNDATLTIVLRHDSPHVSHNIGRFRLSATTLPDAKLDDIAPAHLVALQTPPEKRTDAQREQIAAAHRASDAAYAKLVAQRDELTKSLAGVATSGMKVMVMADMPQPRKTFMLTRGLYNKPGEEVTAGVPAKFPPLPDGVPVNRLALAEWLVADENPLTARVTVNRFWQQFFGLGLVKTTEDFGVQGEIPPQQDLLDWLAADFRQHGWDVKRLVKQIVMSHTYRQSSRISPDLRESDPENRLLARGPRYRLPSPMIRDQSLAASGLLVATVGGPPVKGYQPSGVWEEATFGNKRYQQDHGDALYRRSLYTFWRRIIAPTMFFDNASRQTCTVKVLRTNTPLHALLTLNDVTFVEAARALAERVVLLESLDDASRIDEVYRRVLARRASDKEREILLRALNRSREEFLADGESAKKLLAMGEAKRNESLDPAEHAAWTSLALAVMNTDEALTKE
jgi:hypothetical protein